MNKKDELNIELAKNKAEEFVIKKELEFGKRDLINSIINGMGEEIKTSNFYEINPKIHYKKPLNFKIKKFFEKIKKVVGL